MKRRSKLFRRRAFQIFELTVEVRKIAIAYIVGNQSDGPLTVDQQSTRVTDPELRDVIAGRHPSLALELPV